MLLMRIVGLLAAIAIGSCILTYLFTADRAWLRLAARLAKYALLFAALVLLLLTAERLLVL